MVTKIEWTDEVWNPVTGCTKFSQGCKNCYAEDIANRFWGERKFTDVQCHPEKLSIPYHWKKPRRIFVNSMSDLFHEKVDWNFIFQVFQVMAQTPHHTYQILTKRSQNMAKMMPDIIFHLERQRGGYKLPLPNVWLGVSVEDQETADERIPWLLRTPAAVRFISYEPALGPVDFNAHEYLCETWRKGLTIGTYLDWIVAGGESGPGARPAHPDWFRSVRDQCIEAKVPFFFKQWGEWIPVFESEWERRPDIAKNGLFERVGKKQAGRLLDGQEWNEYPEMEMR